MINKEVVIDAPFPHTVNVDEKGAMRVESFLFSLDDQMDDQNFAFNLIRRQGANTLLVAALENFSFSSRASLPGLKNQLVLERWCIAHRPAALFPFKLSFLTTSDGKLGPIFLAHLGEEDKNRSIFIGSGRIPNLIVQNQRVFNFNKQYSFFDERTGQTKTVYAPEPVNLLCSYGWVNEGGDIFQARSTERTIEVSYLAGDVWQMPGLGRERLRQSLVKTLTMPKDLDLLPLETYLEQECRFLVDLAQLRQEMEKLGLKVELRPASLEEEEIFAVLSQNDSRPF